MTFEISSVNHTQPAFFAVRILYPSRYCIEHCDQYQIFYYLSNCPLRFVENEEELEHLDMDRVLNSARQLDNFTWNLRQEIRMIE